MKKTLLTLASIIILNIFLVGQNYTWKRGSDLIGQPGIYGTMGVSSSTVDPGGRHGSATWVDNNGDLWLFGGEGYGTSSTNGWLNDLWKYSRATNQWTWIRGASVINQAAVYGTMGVPASTNEPGAREFPVSWTDNNGNFWMFGGDGYDGAGVYGRLGDLWKYNPTTNQWTFIKGFSSLNQYGVYGTMGAAASTNMPGARYGAAGWTDNQGNLWMWGGRGYASAAPATFLSDLWKYNIITNQWTWVNGSNFSQQPGVFGTLNVPSTTNTPPAKEFPSTWKDAQGNFYLFGGRGAGYFSDMFRYDVLANTWTWISGPSIPNQIGVYGTKGVSSSSNAPGGRFAAASWTDHYGNFWLFGGTGWSATSLNTLDDLFRFDPCKKEWTWLKGSDTTNQFGNYGTVNVPAATNSPGSRFYSNFWTSPDGNLWLMGGEGFDSGTNQLGHMNDVWTFVPHPDSDSLSSLSGQSICSGKTTTLTAHLTGSSTINWYSSPTSTVSIATGSVFSPPTFSTGSTPSIGSFYASNGSCGLKPKSKITITVQPLPTLSVTTQGSVFCLGESTSVDVSGADTYSWSTNATGTTTSLTFTNVGTYSLYVTGTDSIGCSKTEVTTFTVMTCVGFSNEMKEKLFSIYPVPSTGEINILLKSGSQAEFKLLNALGVTIDKRDLSTSLNKIVLSVPPGLYSYEIRNNEGTVTGKLIIQ